jgi:non-ribosomal peptide synthetase component F
LNNPLLTHGSSYSSNSTNNNNSNNSNNSNSNSSTRKRVLLLSSFTFDPSAGDAFGALVRGDTVCIAPRDALLSSPSSVLRRMRITHVHATPAVWALVDFRLALPDLRVVALGGERSPPSLTDPWVSRGVRVLNVYGATEGTVYQTASIIQHSDAEGGESGQGVDIGKAIANVHAHVLDPETLEPASEGVYFYDLLSML